MFNNLAKQVGGMLQAAFALPIAPSCLKIRYMGGRVTTPIVDALRKIGPHLSTLPATEGDVVEADFTLPKKGSVIAVPGENTEQFCYLQSVDNLTAFDLALINVGTMPEGCRWFRASYFYQVRRSLYGISLYCWIDQNRQVRFADMPGFAKEEASRIANARSAIIAALQQESRRQANWQICVEEVHKPSIRFSIGCDAELVKSLFYSRPLPFIGNKGKHPAILHLESAHQTRLNDRVDVDIPELDDDGRNLVVIGHTRFVVTAPELQKN